MGGFSIGHWVVVLAVVVVLFGRGKISEVLGDVGKGVRRFKKGITEEEETPYRSSGAGDPSRAGRLRDASRDGAPMSRTSNPS